MNISNDFFEVVEPIVPLLYPQAKLLLKEGHLKDIEIRNHRIKKLIANPVDPRESIAHQDIDIGVVFFNAGELFLRGKKINSFLLNQKRYLFWQTAINIPHVFLISGH